jgi:hypothetical protein
VCLLVPTVFISVSELERSFGADVDVLVFSDVVGFSDAERLCRSRSE